MVTKKRTIKQPLPEVETVEIEIPKPTDDKHLIAMKFMFLSPSHLSIDNVKTSVLGTLLEHGLGLFDIVVGGGTIDNKTMQGPKDHQAYRAKFGRGMVCTGIGEQLVTKTTKKLTVIRVKGKKS